MDLQEFDVNDGLDCSASGQGFVAGACECCNDPSGSTN